MKLITFIISTGVFIMFSAFIMKKENTSLFDTKWSLKKIHTEAGTKEVATKAFIKFNEEKKSAAGNGSCNSFGSNVTIEGNSIDFRNIFSTKMYCEDVQKTEDEFFRQLENATRFEIKEKTLLIYQDNTLILEFLSE